MRAPSIVSSLALVLLMAVLPAVASAAGPGGDPAAVSKVTNLNKKALDAYNKQDYDVARSLLKEALEVCATAGLDQHPITARTHIHFGVVAIVGFKQREVGIKQFRKALEIQPDIKLTKSLVTPALEDAFEEAVLAGNGGGAPPAAGGGDDDKGGAPAQQAEDGGEGGEGAPPPRRAKAPPRKKHGDDDDDGKDDKDAGGGGGGGFYFSLQGGTGFGLASGNAALDASHKLAGAGFALAQAAQIAPEVGYFISRDLLISVALRYQIVSGVNGKPVMNTACGSDMFCSPSTSALAGFAKATWLFGTESFHLTAGGQIGGGSIAHVVVFNDNTCKASATSPTFQQCVDRLNGGPFLIGPTVGFFYDISSSIDLILGLNSALGVPNFTFNFDIQAGVGFKI